MAMENQQVKNVLLIILKSVLILASILLLIYPALSNGYALLYSDSATYIASGHDKAVPIDRPIFYGLFVWNTCMGQSLWIVILLQAVIVFALVYYTFSLFAPSGKRIYFSFLTILVLSLFTGLPNYVCQIMPDLFSGILIWLTLLFYFSKTRKSRIFLGIGILFSAIVHNSNLLTFSLLVSFMVLISFVPYFNELRRRTFVLLALAVGSWLFVPSVNYLFQHEFYISKGGGVFFMGRLIESGIVKEYLDENCENNTYELCKYKDNLPQYGWQFCWDAGSPLYAGGCYETGWGNCWIEKNAEYKKIIIDILTTPKYLSEFVKISIRDFFRQFVYFDMVSFSKLDKGVGLDSVVETYLADHFMMSEAQQLKESIFFTTRNLIQRYFIGFSALFILGWIIYYSFKRKVNRNVWLAILIVLSGLIINALIVSAISMVECRYQGRVIWLVPLIACLMVFVPAKFGKTVPLQVFAEGNDRKMKIS